MWHLLPSPRVCDFPPFSGTRVAVPYDNYLAKLVFSVLFTVFICVLYHPPAATVLLHYNLIMHVLPVKTGVCVSVIYLGGTGGGRGAHFLVITRHVPPPPSSYKQNFWGDLY